MSDMMVTVQVVCINMKVTKSVSLRFIRQVFDHFAAQEVVNLVCVALVDMQNQLCVR